jgi:hypothetical protein
MVAASRGVGDSVLQGGTWINESLEDRLTIAAFTSIALDGNGVPQIS